MKNPPPPKKDQNHKDTGVYILQNTMVGGGGVKWLLGKKWKLRVWGKKIFKKGKGKKEKKGLNPPAALCIGSKELHIFCDLNQLKKTIFFCGQNFFY